MSVRVMQWVWTSSRSGGIDRLVLLAIADWADDLGDQAWPSMGRLAAKTGIHARTVQRSIQALTELGELQVSARAGKNGVNQYRILMTPSAEADGRHPGSLPPRQPAVTRQPVQTPRQAAVSDHGSLPPNTSFNHQEPSLKSISSAMRADVERICAHLADRIEANGSRRPTITQRWRTAARLMLDRDERSEQQILAAIDWCQSDEFWRSNILSMPKLRDRYDQLRLAAARDRPNRRVMTSTTDERFRSNAHVVQRLRASEQEDHLNEAIRGS